MPSSFIFIDEKTTEIPPRHADILPGMRYSIDREEELLKKVYFQFLFWSKHSRRVPKRRKTG